MSDPEGAQSASVTFTAADRIKQLNDIEKDVSALLHSAGLAVQALTTSPPESAESSDQSQPLDAHKAAFNSATARYFSLLSSITVRLRRQIYALEEANIVSPDQAGPGLPALAGATSSNTQAQAAADKGGIAAGGLGNLDVGWLNSRRDEVGKEMEAELWAKARELLADSVEQPKENTDVEMKD
ncbi:hypothetical protein L228DRAFT_236165 [Xylona heveae TC161]|uniref:Mediator of RNA polymerase II transcription subunit 11 n=1 Tax=Xylona heveae (strain CBS 132557 / TC161) TaxID=1328760 RepID=A0A165IKH5_XYLHT|nr:hypothetical protein L228DRAFT_236165 [Xylona heveae TC161]KZF25026.1 hypothetical protein L228DRAFT_236165 [Xylona heveae TC161]